MALSIRCTRIARGIASTLGVPNVRLAAQRTDVNACVALGNNDGSPAKRGRPRWLGFGFQHDAGLSRPLAAFSVGDGSGSGDA